MTEYPMPCDCCHITVEVKYGGDSRRYAVITYNGRNFIGWKGLAHHLGMTDATAYNRAKKGKCLKEAKWTSDSRKGGVKRRQMSGEQISTLMGAWK